MWVGGYRFGLVQGVGCGGSKTVFGVNCAAVSEMEEPAPPLWSSGTPSPVTAAKPRKAFAALLLAVNLLPEEAV